jgi:phosphatidylglycerol:prolipoprotein diacylglycerol transferase
LFHFWGRLGCFLYGCCFGIESSIGFKFFTSPIEIANGITRLPVQLVEAIYNLILFILLHNLKTKKLFKGQLFYFYLLLYSSGRFILEFYRGDIYRGIYWHLSLSQIISIVILVGILFRMVKYAYKKYRSVYRGSDSGGQKTCGWQNHCQSRE